MEFYELKGIIEKSIRQVRSVADITQKTGLSHVDLNTVFVLQEGVTAARYVRKVRLMKMQELLATTKLANAEIARRVGYGTEEAASRAFKKAMGMTMRQYQRRAMGRND